MAKSDKKAWDKLQAQGNPRYTDIYEDQQLEHRKKKKKASMTLRIIAATLAGVGIGFVGYMIMCILINVFVRHSLKIPDILFIPSFWSILVGIGVGVGSYFYFYAKMKANYNVQNAREDVSDMLQYDDDAHIQLPEEMQRNYDISPDLGANTHVKANAILSHYALSNKGIKPIKRPVRAKKDIVEDGEVVIHKGEIITDEEGNTKYETVPFIDEPFMDELFDASGMTEKEFKIHYDGRNIPYNPGGKNRDKLNYNTVADLINDDWEIKDFEVQRPCGVYIVDSAPVNVLVIAMTRAGKGCMTPAA